MTADAGVLSADPAVAVELAEFFAFGKGAAWATLLHQMAARSALLHAAVAVADRGPVPAEPRPHGFAYRPGKQAASVLSDGRQPTLRVLNLGAGVQSTVMALMAATGELLRPDVAIFADTGAEPHHVYEHVAWLRPVLADAGIRLAVVDAGSLLDDLLALAGPEPGRIAQPPLFTRGGDGKGAPLRRACTHDYKVVPVKGWIRDHLGVEAGKPMPRDVAIEQWFGMTTDEVERMRDPSDSWAVNRYPLVEANMTRLDCENWLTARGYPVPGKSACTFCPYRKDRALASMRDTDAPSWAMATVVDQIVRDTVPGVNNQAFVHRKLIPLSVVPIDGPRGQGILFDEIHGDCEGICEW